MRRSVSAVILSSLLCLGAAAAIPQASREATIEAETRARIILQTEISSKLNEAGDKISAVLDEPVYANGEIVMPRGTEFIGRITQAMPAGRGQKNGQISIIFEQIRMSWGAVPVAVMLTAIDDWNE
jgi:type IV secretory pathway VirB10-like protein